MIKLVGDEYNSLLCERPDESYKGTFGILGAVVGSKSYQGAAYFSVLSALRTGVGIAIAYIPDVIYDAFASKINGAVIEALKSNNGKIADDTLLDKIKSRNVTALLCGCGLGLDKQTLTTVKTVVNARVPLVLDGDALSAVSSDVSLIKRDWPTVITPHIGEFSRLTNTKIEDINKYKNEIVSNFSVKYKCITVLKDSTTVISDTDGTLYSLSKPCSALSKGGSGDVLAGMVASFLAQGMIAVDSVVCAVTLHNHCGRVCAEKIGKRFSQPEDFVNVISTLKV